MGRSRRTETAVVYDPDSLMGQMAPYLHYLAVRQFSERSVGDYRWQIGRFITWANERGLTRAQEITRPVLLRYQHWLHLYRQKNGQPLSAVTQIGRLVALRGWFSWLTRNHYLLYNPAADLDLPRKPQRLPRHVLTATEAEMVLLLPDTQTEQGLRDRAIMEVLYSTGIRRQELLDLNLDSVDAQRGCLFINQGKGKKDRLSPISQRALGWVNRYCEQVREQWLVDQAEQALFLSLEGQRLSAVRLTSLVSGYIQRANLGKKGACHVFRHTMATLLLENGADIRHIQAILGHSDLSSTQLYTQLSVKQLKRVHERCHPGWRLTRGRGQDEAENE